MAANLWMLIVTTYIVLLITFQNKEFLILVWAFMANNNVNNEAFGGAWLPGPFWTCQPRIGECFGYMALENANILLDIGIINNVYWQMFLPTV